MNVDIIVGNTLPDMLITMLLCTPDYFRGHPLEG